MNYIFLIVVIVAVVIILGIAAFSNFALDNDHYDRLKWLAMKWHYITAFVALLVKLFDFHYGSETVLIVAGIGALMAGLLGVSTHNYPDDEIAEYDDEFDEDDEPIDEIGLPTTEEGDE